MTHVQYIQILTPLFGKLASLVTTTELHTLYYKFGISFLKTHIVFLSISDMFTMCSNSCVSIFLENLPSFFIGPMTFICVQILACPVGKLVSCFSSTELITSVLNSCILFGKPASCFLGLSDINDTVQFAKFSHPFLENSHPFCHQ